MSADRISRRGFLAAGAALAAFATAARAQDSGAAAGAAGGTAAGGAAADGVAEGKTVKVLMKDIAFEPAEIEVHVGDTVEWVNEDPVDHTATVTDKWDIVVAAGDSGTLLITPEIETTEYFCRFHPNMVAKLTVVS